ncbi:hypothetical protein U1Q18_008315 [Sarracenia purpurea var. burkii]
MEEESSTLKLIMEKGPRVGETLEFKPRSVVRIGRVARGNTFSVKDAGVSSKHLSIVCKSGTWVITDLDSSNGTVLNGSHLRPLSPADLNDGDVIKFGEYTCIKVEIQVCGAPSQSLRQNPRRRAAKGGDVVTEDLNRIDGSKANPILIGEGQRRRGRPRRAKVTKCETEEDLCEVEAVEKLDNVGKIVQKQRWQVNTRTTRSSKKKDNSSQDGNDRQGVDIQAQIADTMTKMGTGRKNNSQDEPPERVGNEVFHETEELGSVQEERKEVKDNLLNEQSELGNKGSGNEAGDEPDLEKMTLEEWFDYLEVYLPKQIFEKTEEMILGMNKSAEQFYDFISKQKNDKEKGKMTVD